ncbi:ZYRO0E06886p [Zygosaccharomyces rouxii]|uniref:Origin recognition complex subunit 2 n=1 Tax=Zygosaccharomyces rouxii (strain ATCC 2623 / CBS 732 / NBRC 1130 / NCYC 568 / NRRL Y-229) TaxID=559307 RepID=C5E4K6_ZYGRC|nr:uncharacterized protein ZYRO0E06886g [Zygosaccharomyces rouxii]KAH9198177.1 origin recognition complex subunit 2-domain-containing protein [Zygosaccharomyces rouxii]CAR30967.1 ZYRO0E06886p [Zygosaccharomyces rouxii]
MSDDGIVKHVDILSSPSKARGKVTCRVVSKRRSTPVPDGLDRKRSPKKNLLERIERSPTPGGIWQESSDLSSSESPIGKRKRSESRRTKSQNDDKEEEEDNNDDGGDAYVSNGDEEDKLDRENKRHRRLPSRSETPIPVLASPVKTTESENEVSITTTPQKKTPKKTLSTEHDFTSPLKKVILSNLDEYKNTASSENLKLSRNFVPTPLPTAKEKYVPTTTDKSMSSFFDTFEGYFDQRKQLRGSQKSKNTMSMATDVTREEFALISNTFHGKLHRAARDGLYEIQTRLFPQYWFELTQGFSLLFYGVGSKREFLERYVFEYLAPNLVSDESSVGVPCVVVNGYNPTCNYRDVFKDISRALLPQELSRNETKYWGNHVILQIQKMIELYKNEPPDIKLVIVIHNLDGPSLRKDNFQTMLCYLALIRQVALVASTDHIYAPILWDNFKAQNYNFVFHDVSNYEPLAVESSFKDVMKMNRNNSASGAEGAKFVLESLTHNTKRMYKVLLETQISNMNSHASNARGQVPPTKRGSPTVGVELKQLLHLCSAEFVASNEISLRSMLTEFVEHKMAAISKNPAGTEHVWIPYNYSEINKLLSTVMQSI